jgi:hypothetical protein
MRRRAPPHPYLGITLDPAPGPITVTGLAYTIRHGLRLDPDDYFVAAVDDGRIWLAKRKENDDAYDED